MTDRIRVLTSYPPTVTVSGAQKKPRGPRKRSLTTLIKRAKAAGVDVVLAPDGCVILKCGQSKSADDPATEENEWDTL